MASRSPRGRGGRAAQRAAPSVWEEVEARAARLGITPERILREYARLAFSDLSRIADWRSGEDGLQVKPAAQLDPADVAAIAEIVAAASSGRIYRIKLHDKAAVLGALARCLGMLPKAAPASIEDEPTENEAEAARRRLIDALDRLAAEEAAGPGGRKPEQAGAGGA